MAVIDYNNTYEPSHLVHEIHHLPHLDASLQLTSSTFDITYDSQWNSYARSLLPLPLICMCIGGLAVFSLQIAICFRYCCPSCRCLPTVDLSHPQPQDNINLDQSTHKSPEVPRVRHYYYAFFLFAVLTILFDQTVIFGSNDLVSGVKTSDNALNYVQNLFDSLVNYGNVLNDDGDSLDSLFTSATAQCPEASQLQSALSEYFVYVGEYQDFVNPVPSQVSQASDQLNKYGTEYKNSSMWSLYGIVMLGIALFCGGLFLKSKLTLQLSVGFVQLLLYALFALCGVEMVIMMGLGDFCIAPSTYVQTLMPPDIQNITSYYVTCVGQNPMDESIYSADALVVQGTAAVNNLLANVSNCNGNTYLEQSLVVLNNIDIIFSNITTAIDCPPLQSQLLDVLENGLCHTSFMGFYTIWIGQFCSTSCLFLATIFVSLLYQYFNPHWDIEQQSLRGDGSLNSSYLYDTQKRDSRSNPNLLFMENNAAANEGPSTSPNEFYYNTSALHNTGQNSNSVLRTEEINEAILNL